MILINKEEAMAIREKFKNAAITRTVKSKSKRHKYYCEERPAILAFLKKYRDKKNIIYSGDVT